MCMSMVINEKINQLMRFSQAGLWKTLHNLKGVSFYRKVRWRMRYDRNPLLITLQDKYKVRQYAESRQVSTAELLYVTDQPELIPFKTLTGNYFIKANHGCRWNILCFNSCYYIFGNGEDLVNSDGTFINEHKASKFEISISEVIDQCNEWLKSRHKLKEWAYQHIHPLIIVERFLEPNDNNHLKDYRMYTFYGKVKVISIGSALYRKTKENVFFNTDWMPVRLTQSNDQLPTLLPQKPEALSEMIRAAEKLGAGIIFSRIDLYDTIEGAVLGEMTVYPDGGCSGTPTTCPVFNTWLGDQWIDQV